MTKIISSNIGNNSKGIENPLVPPIDAFFKIRDLAKYAIESGGAHPKSIQEITTSLGLPEEQVLYVIWWYVNKGIELEKPDSLKYEGSNL